MLKRATLMIGLPGYGKSSWIVKNDNPNEVIISSDKFIEEFARNNSMTYNEAFHQFKTPATELMYDEFRNSLNTKPLMMIDRCNLTISSRRQFIEPLIEANYHIIGIVFPHPADWEKRLDRKGKEIPQDVLVKMAMSYQEPSLDEGFHLLRVPKFVFEL